MYSSQRAKAIVMKDVAYLEAGIHDNIKLDNVRVDQSPYGNNFIEFRFVAENGKSMVHTEWEPTKGPNTTDEMLQAKCDNQFKRIDQILECFYPNEAERVFYGNTFSEFASWVMMMLHKADTNILLRIKVVYNNNGYTTLPKYAKYTFIEPMSTVNAGKSLITKLNIDLFEKPIVADTESNNPNPLNNTVNILTETDNPDQLPF